MSIYIVTDTPEAVPTESEPTFQHRPVYRNTVTNQFGKVKRYTEHASESADILTALATSEQNELELLDSKDKRSLAWAFHSRIFVSILCHLAQLAIRFSDQVLTKDEFKHYNQFAQSDLFRKFLLPTNVVHHFICRIYRIQTPTRSILSYPYIRSGLFISPVIQDNSSTGPFRKVWVSNNFKYIPSVRIAMNFIYLHKHRRELLHETTNKEELIIKHLLIGYNCDETLVVYKRDDSFTLLETLLKNIVFEHRLGNATPKQVSDSLDALEYTFEPKEISPDSTFDEEDSHDHNAWIEPLPDRSWFEQLNLFSLRSFQSRPSSSTSCCNPVEFSTSYTGPSGIRGDTLAYIPGITPLTVPQHFWLEVLNME
jgi:hypothetical protein